MFEPSVAGLYKPVGFGWWAVATVVFLVGFCCFILLFFFMLSHVSSASAYSLLFWEFSLSLSLSTVQHKIPLCSDILGSCCCLVCAACKSFLFAPKLLTGNLMLCMKRLSSLAIAFLDGCRPDFYKTNNHS